MDFRQKSWKNSSGQDSRLSDLGGNNQLGVPLKVIFGGLKFGSTLTHRDWEGCPTAVRFPSPDASGSTAATSSAADNASVSAIEFSSDTTGSDCSRDTEIPDTQSLLSSDSTPGGGRVKNQITGHSLLH